MVDGLNRILTRSFEIPDICVSSITKFIV